MLRIPLGRLVDTRLLLSTTHPHETVCVGANGIERSGFGFWSIHGGRKGSRYVWRAHARDSKDKVLMTVWEFVCTVSLFQLQSLKMVDFLVEGGQATLPPFFFP
jgi:hypothetical protein